MPNEHQLNFRNLLLLKYGYSYFNSSELIDSAMQYTESAGVDYKQYRLNFMTADGLIKFVDIDMWIVK